MTSRRKPTIVLRALAVAVVALPMLLIPAPAGAAPSAVADARANAAPPPRPTPDVDGQAPAVTDIAIGAGRTTAGSSQQTEASISATSTSAIADRIMLADVTRPVAPDVTLRSFEWMDAGGFMRGDLLTVNLATGTVKPDYINTGKVAAAAPLTDQAQKRGAVAAVNGDFFDINNSNAPLGAAKQANGTVVKGPVPGHNHALGVTDSNMGTITKMFLQGRIQLPFGTVELAGLNQHAIGTDGVAVFTPLWGSYTRTTILQGATKARELLVRDGVVVAIGETAGSAEDGNRRKRPAAQEQPGNSERR